MLLGKSLTEKPFPLFHWHFFSFTKSNKEKSPFLWEGRLHNDLPVIVNEENKLQTCNYKLQQIIIKINRSQTLTEGMRLQENVRIQDEMITQRLGMFETRWKIVAGSLTHLYANVHSSIINSSQRWTKMLNVVYIPNVAFFRFLQCLFFYENLTINIITLWIQSTSSI